MTVAEILAEVRATRSACGGDGRRADDRRIRRGTYALARYDVTIETAGTVYRSVKCDLMSISPNSPIRRRRAGSRAA